MQYVVIKYKTLSIINKANQGQFVNFIFSFTEISIHMRTVF